MPAPATRTLYAYMDENIEKQMEKLIHDDNKQEFTSFLTSHASVFSPAQLFKLVCMHGAIGCATSLLEENNGFYVDVNGALEGGLLPLQLAAQRLSYDLTSLLLEHGAQANVCDNNGGSRDLAMLPLNMALKALCDQWGSDWSPGKSIFKLLYIFCLRDLKESLDTIRLLAERMEDLEKVSLFFVEEGEVVRLAALLMVAWNRLVPPNVENAEKSLIGQHIWRQIAAISNQELRFMINCGPNSQVLECLKSKKINLLNQWKFLKVLEIARDVIEEYPDSWSFKTALNHEVPYDVAYLLYQSTELVLKPDDVFSDDIECLRPKLKPIEKAQLNKVIEKQMQLWSMLPECKTREADRSKASLQKELFVRPMISSDAMPICSYERDRNVEVSDIDDDDDDIDDDRCLRLVEHALKLDNKDDFVRLINSFPSEQLERDLDTICFYMYLWDCRKCAAAVIAGETKISNGIALLSSAGSSPLHHAAVSGACSIMALLLESGFSADVRCDCPRRNLSDVLPLDVALSQLRFNMSRCNLKGRTSAVKIIVELFKGLWGILETVRLLSQHTREVKREFFKYLKEGKLVEVGALLLVARSRLLSSSAAEGEFRSISEMHDFVLDAKRPLSAGPSPAEKNKLIAMDETLVLLQIFDRIGDKLATLIRLDIRSSVIFYSSLAAASLIEDAGFDVKAEDVYYSNHTSGMGIEFVLERGVDDFTKTAFTTYALPSWLKEAGLSGSVDKSASSSHSTYPSFLGALPTMNRVSVSVMSSMPENMPLDLCYSGSATSVGHARLFQEKSHIFWSKTKFGSVVSHQKESRVFRGMALEVKSQSKIALHHLLKKNAPFVGAAKRVFRC